MQLASKELSEFLDVGGNKKLSKLLDVGNKKLSEFLDVWVAVPNGSPLSRVFLPSQVAPL